MKLLFTFTVVLLATFSALAQAEPVKIQSVTIRGDARPGSNIVAIVSVQIEKGTYLQTQRPLSNRLTRTDVAVGPSQQVQILPASFSSGRPKTITGFKEPVLVYEGGFSITVPFAIYANAALPATVPAVLIYQPTVGDVPQAVKRLPFEIVIPNSPPKKP